MRCHLGSFVLAHHAAATPKDGIQDVLERLHLGLEIMGPGGWHNNGKQFRGILLVVAAAKGQRIGEFRMEFRNHIQDVKGPHGGDGNQDRHHHFGLTTQHGPHTNTIVLLLLLLGFLLWWWMVVGLGGRLLCWVVCLGGGCCLCSNTARHASLLPWSIFRICRVSLEINPNSTELNENKKKSAEL